MSRIVIDYSSHDCQIVLADIKNWREKGVSWEKILQGNVPFEIDISKLDEHIKMYLTMKCVNLTVDDYKQIVNDAFDYEKNGEKLRVIPNEKKQNTDITIPQSNSSAWKCYKSHLLNDSHFSLEDADAIEKSTLTMLRFMHSETEAHKPIKGLAIGNVQSGKTASMAGLISMASDYGYNLFILLSGTIENLRVQTSKRLSGDLYFNSSNVHINEIDRVENKDINSLHFEEGSRERYFVVCLKNSTRLNHLLNWLNKDQNKKKQMRILLIDDEADQASINTAEIEKDEKTKINRYITDIVFDTKSTKKGKDWVRTDYKEKFGAINYIGYTATPFGNVLNEGPSTLVNPYSLFPEDFIITLENSKKYFGPERIFGNPDKNTYGMNIINHISKDEVDYVKKFSKKPDSFLNDSLPDGLIESLLWFYCCVGIFRYWDKKYPTPYPKPISLLININQKVGPQNILGENILSLFNNPDLNQFIEACKIAFDNQTRMMSRQDFLNSVGIYTGDDVRDYPSFDEIKPYIEEAISVGLDASEINSSGDHEYTRGVILAIDNGTYNPKNDSGIDYRIHYPDKHENPGYTTAFIVIGGQTLSRGLTIEGLVSTYFNRDVKQGDSLMQMGRWFGYRPHYELLPRIWISQDIDDKFTFLTLIDHKLKLYIEELNNRGGSPKDYGVKLLNSPYPSWLSLTSKSKMQSAIPAGYSNDKYQTTTFFNDQTKLQNNINRLSDLITKMDNCGYKTSTNKNNLVWFDVDFNLVIQCLEMLQFPKEAGMPDVKTLKEWFVKYKDQGQLIDGNVIIGGLDSAPYGFRNLSNRNVSKVGRAANPKDDTDVLRLHAIRNNTDLYSDIDPTFVKSYNQPHSTLADIRKMKIEYDPSFEKKVNVIFYLIDKNSKADTSKKSKTIDLHAVEDIVGVAFDFPFIAESNQVMVDLEAYRSEHPEEYECLDDSN